jgi:hypothetical protein
VGEVPACTKHIGAQGRERDVEMLECTKKGIWEGRSAKMKMYTFSDSAGWVTRTTGVVGAKKL